MAVRSWLKIIIRCEPQLLEPISDFIVGVMDAGVELAAADEPGYGTLNCYVENPDPDPEEIETTIGKISDHINELSEIFSVEPPVLTHELIREEDWGRSWKQYFKPFAIVDGLVICPSWEEYTAVPGESVIVMDPGMAFGTGHHGTTALCLEYIRDCLEGGSGYTVLDVGTGTGILAMAALKFGAAGGAGIDNDPDAVAAASQNIINNGMQDRVEISGRDLSLLTTQYDIVVANIIHDALVELADDLIRVIRSGGWLILSGILEENQRANIEELFQARGLAVESARQRNEWAAVLLRKGI